MPRTCPRCDLTMNTSTYRGRLTDPISHDGISVTVDYCEACSGYWFDRHEVEITLGARGELRALLGDDLKPSSHGALPCPAGCADPLASVRVLDLELDLCSGCAGLWFDGAELKQLERLLTTHGYDAGDFDWRPCVSCGHTPEPSHGASSVYSTAEGPMCRGCLCLRVAPPTAFVGGRRPRRTAGAAREALDRIDRDTMRAIRAWSNMAYG